MNKNLASSLVVLFFLGSSGCKSLTSLSSVTPKKPEVSVKNMKLNSINSKSGEVEMTLLVKNPNVFKIVAESINYNLKVNNFAVVKGVTNDKVVLLSGKSSEIKVPIVFEVDSLIGMIGSVINNRKFSYNLSGGVKLPFVSVPFSKSGSLLSVN